MSKNLASIRSAALPAAALNEGQSFAKLSLPLQPPYPPAEARSVKELPRETGWLYEPKWDGFRCLAFRGDEIVLQSKAGQPLTRYFPEIVEALRTVRAQKFVLDGEIVVAGHGHGAAALDFDALLQRIHPAASRVQRLAHETPAMYMLFDLLVNEKGESITSQPLSARRMKLEKFVEKFLLPSSNALQKIAGTSSKATSRFASKQRIQLSAATANFSAAEKWMREGATHGWDGVVAKRLDCEYTSGERTGMVKVKRIRTADCVVGGFRWARGAAGKAHAKKPGEQVGSLLLGLYNARGELDHIGFSSSFTRDERKKLRSMLKPLIAGPARNSGEHVAGDKGGFTGKAPGGPSRWTRDERDTEWVPLKPELVGEFQYDHFSGGRFRHGTKFLRWRPDKKPRQCTMEQVKPGRKSNMSRSKAERG
ncbi:MAG TPA: ATP-dependent DNA ligase [Candidatus Angelobacter sp.]